MREEPVFGLRVQNQRKEMAALEFLEICRSKAAMLLDVNHPSQPSFCHGSSDLTNCEGSWVN